MQIPPLKTTNNKPSFQARLKIKDEDRVLTKFDRNAIKEAASKVGTQKDLIKVELGDYYEGDVHNWAEQGLGWMTEKDDDYVFFDVNSNINNKVKSEEFLATGSTSTIGTDIVEQLTGYFKHLAGK